MYGKTFFNEKIKKKLYPSSRIIQSLTNFPKVPIIDWKG